MAWILPTTPFRASVVRRIACATLLTVVAAGPAHVAEAKPLHHHHRAKPRAHHVDAGAAPSSASRPASTRHTTRKPSAGETTTVSSSTAPAAPVATTIATTVAPPTVTVPIAAATPSAPAAPIVSPPSPTASTSDPSAPDGVPYPSNVTPTLAFSDDFSDASDISPDDWNLYWGAGNGGYGLRRPSAISVNSDGDLVITAAMQDGTVVSGGMGLRLNQTYGRYVVRVRTDADPSAATSGVVLTWPESNDWPIDGESDMYETLASPTRQGFQSAIHYGADDEQTIFRAAADDTQWHTIVMDWTPTAISTYDDGSLVGTTTNPAAIPDVPQHLCLQLDAVDNNPLSGPVTMEVDYVKVYSYAVTGSGG